ncbi:VOC family protein [Azospirillum sp. SYSU D00513]|uniref:VOC family protein n=1 Tax=Azospirillum sp. SYSU D00513 TaxID=2812561 RepID=UPI001A95BACB|nr:VOC family protein [Azospirillum sp. SYSU D00513]
MRTETAPAITVRIAHVALWTPDIDRSAEFWQRHFGAEVGPLYHSARRPGFTSRFLKLAGGAELELMAAPWVEREGYAEERHGWAHVAVSVGSEEQVRALAARLEGEGLLVSAPRMTGDGYYEAVVRDPDGNFVEITS